MKHSISRGRDLEKFMDSLRYAMEQSDPGYSHVSIELREVEGFPPMIYGTKGTEILIHIPGPTPEQFVEDPDSASKYLHDQIEKMISEGVF